jgi:hypothetical protein
MSPEMPVYWVTDPDLDRRAAVAAYVNGERLSRRQIAAVREYLCQWIYGDFGGPDVDELRGRVLRITSARKLRKWVRDAVAAGVDPL